MKQKTDRESPFLKMSLFNIVIFVDCLLPAAVTHSHVRIVAADKHLAALGNYVALAVDASVYDSLFAAGANRLYLGDRVGNLKEAAATLEKMCKKVGSKTVAENGDLVYVHDPAELIHLLGGKELALVRNNCVTGAILLEFGKKIGVAACGVSLLRKSYS